MTIEWKLTTGNQTREQWWHMRYDHVLNLFVCLVTLTHAQNRLHYLLPFLFSFSLPVLFVSCFTYLSFAPFVFAACETKRRLQINFKKNKHFLMSETTSQ